MYYIITDFL